MSSQTAEQTINYPKRSDRRYWTPAAYENAGRDLAIGALAGIFLALTEALLSAPWWGNEAGSNSVIVQLVLLNSPAHYTGLMSGDYITAVDGQSITGADDPMLQNLERDFRTLRRITIQRGGHEQEIQLRPVKRRERLSPAAKADQSSSSS